MKTAICLSGELRSIKESWNGIKKYTLSSFDEYDIFYHTWNDDPNLNDLSILVKDGHLKDILIEPRITFDEKNYNTRKRSEVNVQGFLRQLYCLKKCNSLISQFEQDNNFIYDVVVRLRPDIKIVLDSKLENVKPENLTNSVYIPTHDSWFGYNDRFYYSNSANMDILANRFDEIESYFLKGGLIHYETFFKYIVDMTDLKVIDSDLKFVLLRTDGKLDGELVIPNQSKFPLATTNLIV
jgi:hypothetical protein